MKRQQKGDQTEAHYIFLQRTSGGGDLSFVSAVTQPHPSPATVLRDKLAAGQFRIERERIRHELR